jgi:hypothetical protein
MLDPITAYAAKIAATTTAGGVLSAWSLVQAQTGVDVGSAFTAVSGVGLLTAGCWKLLADHTAVERERQTQANRIVALEAEVAAAEAQAREAHMRLQSLREHVLRLGLDPDTLTAFRDHHEGDPP